MKLKLWAAAWLLAAPVMAVDDSFRLVREDTRVNVYSRKPGTCSEQGPDVLFVLENKTRERLELKLELLNAKIKNSLTVLLEPSGNTSVLSLAPEAGACGVELVGMQVRGAGSAL